MNAPINSTDGQTLTIYIDNLSGATRSVTFLSSVFKLDPVFTVPSSLGRSITFKYVAGLWLESARTVAYDF